MAILSKKLKLEAGVWQEIGAISFIGQKDAGSTIEIVNADALPTGDVPEAQTVAPGVNLMFSAPANGSLYVRVKYGAATLKYYEV
jgi:hypothetical protein